MPPKETPKKTTTKQQFDDAKNFLRSDVIEEREDSGGFWQRAGAAAISPP